MTNIEEIWKVIDGFPNYEISSLGRFRGGRFKRIINPGGNGRYKLAGLSCNMKRDYKYIHRLVANAFIPNPENKPYVCHKDNNKDNNRVDNLMWGTASENVTQARSDGLGSRKLNKLYVIVIREAISNGHSLDNISKYFKTKRRTICQLKNGRSWAYVS